MTRRHWIRLHRWVGLALGLHWALLALTGLILVYHRDLESLLLVDGRSPVADEVAVARAIDVAEREAPGRDIKRVAIHNAPLASARVFLAPQRGEATVLIVDLDRARVVSAGPPEGALWRGNFFGFVYKLHHTLRLGRGGEVLVSISGGFLVATVLAGLWLAWPKRRWRPLLLPRLAGPASANLFLIHRAAGFVIAPLILISALTGIGMIWSKELRETFADRAPVELPAGLPVEEREMSPIEPAEAVAAAKRRFPGAALTLVDLPISPHEPYQVRLRQRTELRRIFGTTAVTVDAYSAQVLDAYDPANASAVEQGLDALFAIHNGEVLGPVGRALLAAAGLLLATVSTVGVGAWVLRRRRSNARGGALYVGSVQHGGP